MSLKYIFHNWIHIDKWNWVAGKFEDEYFSFSRIDVLNKIIINGFIATKEGNIPVVNVEVTTKTKDDGKTPVSSEFIVTDKNGKKRTIISNTLHSLHLPLPAKEGTTEIFEQVVIFKCDDKKADGISEYLISTRK